MRINLEVLKSVDLIITASIVQSGDESVIVSVYKEVWSRSCICHPSHMRGVEAEPYLSTDERLVH